MSVDTLCELEKIAGNGPIPHHSVLELTLESAQKSILFVYVRGQDALYLVAAQASNIEVVELSM